MLHYVNQWWHSFSYVTDAKTSLLTVIEYLFHRCRRLYFKFCSNNFVSFSSNMKISKCWAESASSPILPYIPKVLCWVHVAKSKSFFFLCFVDCCLFLYVSVLLENYSSTYMFEYLFGIFCHFFEIQKIICLRSLFELVIESKFCTTKRVIHSTIYIVLFVPTFNTF